MRRILSVGVLQSLLRAKNEALRHAGFRVQTCTSVAAAKSLFREAPFDVVVIGHGIRVDRRVALAKFLRERFPAARIIFLYLSSIDAAELADAVLSAGGPPEDVVATVEHLLTTGQTRVVSIQPENPPQAPRLPVVLCVCLSDLPAILRQNLLSSRQYEVLRAASLSEVEMVCKNRHIDLTIFGAAVGPWFKTAVFELLRQHNRNPEIFEIGQAQAFLPSARTVGDSPEALMKAVNAFILHVPRTTPQVNRP